MESYTLNSAENLLLDIRVRNDGEHAYGASLTVDIPEDVSLVRLHQPEVAVTWQEDHAEMTGRNRLQLSLGNPLLTRSLVRHLIALISFAKFSLNL